MDAEAHARAAGYGSVDGYIDERRDEDDDEGMSHAEAVVFLLSTAT